MVRNMFFDQSVVLKTIKRLSRKNKTIEIKTLRDVLNIKEGYDAVRLNNFINKLHKWGYVEKVYRKRKLHGIIFVDTEKV